MSMDNTADPSRRNTVDDDEEKKRKKKTDRERRKERREAEAKRQCGPCKHAMGDHAEMAGRESGFVWCYHCQDLCKKRSTDNGAL